MPSTGNCPRLLAHPREQYLRKEEGRILSAANALIAAARDPQIVAALDAVNFADDLFEIHDVTAKYYGKTGISHRADNHRRYAAKAAQLKFRALDQLAHLVI